MITFFIAIATLIAAYFIYGSFVEKRFGIDENKITPAFSKKDGVDFLPLSRGKIFLIQFLNIAGLGPIFGAIAGALWGPIAFIWIVLGCIFIGSVHDYFSGMLSIRHGGASIPEVVGKYLGTGVKRFMRVFAVALLILVGAVFVKGPATILFGITGINTNILFAAIFIYYLLATMIPIDKLIGRIYPIFGISLLVMAVGITITMISGNLEVPELTMDNIRNLHDDPSKHPIFPLLFITIACGAVSGFHSTQSPLMARCLPNERDGKKIFFGAMIAEGIVALIWAAVAMSFFGGVKELGDTLAVPDQNVAWAVNEICNTLLGKIGGALALIGVVAAPITSGDTAFRSARLTIADAFNIKQDKLIKRFYISIPMFAIAYLLTQIDFSIVWRYMGWANQTLSVFVLWTAAVYMKQTSGKFWFITIPAVFMTAVVTCYILIAPEGFNLPSYLSYTVGVGTSLSFLALFLTKVKTRQTVTK